MEHLTPTQPTAFNGTAHQQIHPIGCSSVGPYALVSGVQSTEIQLHEPLRVLLTFIALGMRLCYFIN